MSEITSRGRADMADSPLVPATLIDILKWRGLHQPERLAYTFLLDGEIEEASLTYRELDRRAQAIAALLQSFDARGKTVLLLYPHGLEYISAFFGCLYAGAIAVPAYPPRLNGKLQRLKAIAADAQAGLVLSTAPILTRIKSLLPRAGDSEICNGLTRTKWIQAWRKAGSYPTSIVTRSPFFNTLPALLRFRAGSWSAMIIFYTTSRLFRKPFGKAWTQL